MSPTEVGQELENAVRKILERHHLDFIDLTESREDVDFVIFFKRKAQRVEVKNHNQRYFETKDMVQKSIVDRNPDCVIGSLKPGMAGMNLLRKNGISLYGLSEQITPFNGALIYPQIDRIIYLLTKYILKASHELKRFVGSMKSIARQVMFKMKIWVKQFWKQDSGSQHFEKSSVSHIPSFAYFSGGI